MERKHRNKIDFNTQAYYYNFKRLNHEITISRLIHTKIIKTFFSIVVYKVINEMFKFNFTGLGLFYIIKKDPKVVEKKDGTTGCLYPINWPETKKVRKLTGNITKKVYYLNDNTRGKIYRFRWDFTQNKFINRSFYSFIVAKSVRQQLHNTINNNIKPLNAYLL
jgi:hypothetical protein